MSALTWSTNTFLPPVFTFIPYNGRKLREACPFKNGWIFGKVPKGGRGVISDPKIYVADFCHYKGYFGHDFQKKSATWFSENEGGGVQRPFGTFPKIHPFWEGNASLSDKWVIWFWWGHLQFDLVLNLLQYCPLSTRSVGWCVCRTLSGHCSVWKTGEMVEATYWTSFFSFSTNFQLSPFS